MICPKCKLPMYWNGMTEKKEDKYFCPECGTKVVDEKSKNE